MTPKEQFRQIEAVDNGLVFFILPPLAREFYEQNIKPVRKELENVPDLHFDMTAGPGPAATEVWNKIRGAQVIVADISGLHPQVMCELGIALALKDGKRLVLINEGQVDPGQLPEDLRAFASKVVAYDRSSPGNFCNILVKKLNTALDAGPPPEVLPDPADRELARAAVEDIRKGNWTVAEVLLTSLVTKYPGNWYPLSILGSLYRDKADFAKAGELLRQASELAIYDQHRALVFVERAKLEHRLKKRARAEEFFQDAIHLDPQNKKIYVEWATVHLEARNAAALQVLGYMSESFGFDDEDVRVLFEYYRCKLDDPKFNMSVDAFRKIWRIGLASGRDSGGPDSRPAMPSKVVLAGDRVPDEIEFADLQRHFVSRKVRARVANVNPSMGVFMMLNPKIRGLLNSAKAGPNFVERFKPGMEVFVTIAEVRIDNCGRQKVDLAID